MSSSKGVVDKSTLTNNLELALPDSSAKNTFGHEYIHPSLQIIFDINGTKSISTQTYHGKTKTVPIEKFELKLLSIGFLTDRNQLIPSRGITINKIEGNNVPIIDIVENMAYFTTENQYYIFDKDRSNRLF